MAKTTATVTVGADTRPFERQMRSLGGGLGGGGGGGGGGILGGMFRSATSALGAGLGLGAAFLGVRGAQSAFDLAKALSPEFAGAMNTISVLLQDSIKPAITTLGKALQRFMPTIESALGSFGRMLDDVVKFWTEDALNPEVWKEIGVMIAEAVKDHLGEKGASLVEQLNPFNTPLQMERSRAIYEFFGRVPSGEEGPSAL